MPPKPPLTHFLCIPLVTTKSRAQLSASLAAFKADVTSADSFGVPEGAVRPLGTLHLTLGVMSFPQTDDGRKGLGEAVGLLRGLRMGLKKADAEAETEGVRERTETEGVREETETKGKEGEREEGSEGMSVTLKGLRSMQQPSKSSILYAPPEDPERKLYDFCTGILARFRDKGLVVEDSRPLLLHATVLNTVYVKVRDRGGGRGRRDKLTVDARGILERYEDCVWAEGISVDKVAICRMGAKTGDDGEVAYEVEAEVDV
ncbi:kinase A anchor protein [Xylariaceae sp. FL1019]|nr:kinase A anchor protein [Xylariaceae sp. FL1019]